MDMRIRPGTVADVDDIMRVCDLAWKGIWQGDPQMFVDRILTFPECGIAVGEIDGRIEGYASVQLANESLIFRPTWNETTDSGHIRKTHNPAGEWLHGVGLAVTPEGCSAGLTGAIISFLHGYMVREKKLGCRFVTRIPGYRRLKGRMSPEEYATTERGGRPIDPELRVLGNHGFRVATPPVIFKNYVEGGGDPDSCGYSVLIELLNPFLGEARLALTKG